MRRSPIYKVILAVATLLSLQSCFVAKDYERPAEVVQEEFFRTDQLPQDSLSITEVSWREMFTDPFLSTYIEEALANNLDIRIALQQMNMARAYLKQGKASYFPSVNAGFSVVHQELAGNNQSLYGRSSIEQFDLTADLSWEADIWGKIRSNEKALQASFLQSVEAHKAVKTELIANLASLYYRLLALDEQLEVTRQTVLNRERSLETIRALKDAGNVTEVGVQQTQAQLYRAQAVVIDLENEIRLLENTFSILLGDAPHQIERSDLERQEVLTELKTGVPVQLLRNRPDVAAAEFNLINAFQLTNVARSNFYPSLRINASTGFQSLDLEDLIDTNNLFASIVGSLTQPIFNRRQIKTQYEVAQAREEIAFLNFRQALLLASGEVSDALYNYQAATEKMEVKLKEAESYDLATSYSEELLNNGLANYLEVLTARENYLNAQLELINIRYDELSAIVNLYQALGGGWE
ncbi:efflux transporter outer membrane subunit [Salinimicrobium catena]|uniref:efflux transporter outer membrane subunit n=1 Tax=Salinimicrobium catena TaxID=390640 RepID=UPI002FE471BD